VRQKFTGKERGDAGSENSLDYFGARYYSGAQGRFTSADEPFADQSALDPQSWNLYAYVRNNPLSLFDPSGRCSTDKNGSYWDADDKGTLIFPGPCDKGTVGNSTYNQNSVTVGVGSDEANLIMLQGVGHNLSSPHQWADVSSNAAQLAIALWGLPNLAKDAWSLVRIGGSAARVLASMGRPSWAETPGGFINWLKNIQRVGRKLTAKEADAVIEEANRLDVGVRLDPPHPGTNWDKPHLNVGKEGQVHLEVPVGYRNSSVPQGSAVRPH
jgi:RHS repeat-associated protein